MSEQKKSEGKWVGLDTVKEYAAEIGAAFLFAGTFSWAAVSSPLKSLLGKAHPYVVLAAAATVVVFLVSHVWDKTKEKKNDQ